MKDAEQTVATEEGHWMCEVTFLNSDGEACSDYTEGWWGPVSCVEQAADLAGELIEHNPYIDRIDIMLVRP